MNLIQKIEALKKERPARYLGTKNIEDELYAQAIDDVVNMPEIQAVDELIKEISDLWLITYPPDIFDGSSGDEGALKVVKIRELVRRVQGEHKE